MLASNSVALSHFEPEYVSEHSSAPNYSLIWGSSKDAAIFLRSQSQRGRKICWIEEDVEKHKVPLLLTSNTLLINGGDDSLWSLFTIVRMKLFSTIVYRGPLSPRVQRILERAAPQYNTFVFLLEE